jgi:serine/threonine-protein kinase
MTVATCPKSETLAAFARGDLAATELAAVSEHVGFCAACAGALKLVPEDTLAGLARAAAAGPHTAQSGTSGVLVSGKSLASDKVPAGFVEHARYRIVSELGAGGMGTVYKAEDQLMGRTVALKVVSSHLTAKASALARFRKEVFAAAQLEHPNIIRAYDTGEAGGAQFLVMEFVEGTSLDRLVAKKGPLQVPMACAFARQAALGLQHAADKGMVHRDIKPQNLMVTRKGQVKILDFGLARFARTDDGDDDAQGAKLPFGAAKAVANAGVTNPNLLMGTPDYLSPEQAKNSHDVDPRSDIYSLGCTLYFLLTGKPPFAGAATLIDKLLAHTEDAPPPIREARFEVPEALAEVLAKMMAKKPGDRYASAKEAADALHPFTRAAGAEPVFEVVEAVVVTPAPLVATPVRRPQDGVDTDAERAGPTLAEVARPKKKKAKKRAGWFGRNKGPVLGAVAGLALVVLVLAAAGGKKKPADAPPDPNAGDAAKGTNPKAPPQGGPKGKDKANPWVPPTVITPGSRTVLFVIPSDGVFLADYLPVRKRLEEKGVTVVTASGDGGKSRPFDDAKSEPVPVDYSFRQMRDQREEEFRKYSAVIFCGARWDEYVGAHPKSWGTKAMLDKAREYDKVVAAICVGQGVLVEHGVLKGRSAARCPQLLKDRPGFALAWRDITWKNDGVVTDGKIITADGPEHAERFADAILSSIQ